MSVWLAIVLIATCAVCWDVGVVLQKKAADRLPTLSFDRRLPRAVLACFASPRWVSGLVISSVGWVLFAWALSFTPVSLARSIQGAGILILAVFSMVFLDHRLTWREWVGVVVVTAGIAALGFSEGGAVPKSNVQPVRLALVCAALLGSCALGWMSRRYFGRGPQWLTVFAALAGVLLGLGDVFTRGLLVALDTSTLVSAVVTYGPLLVLCYLPGGTVLTRAYQHGRAIAVIAVSDFAARVTAIVAGVWGLGEDFPTTTVPLVLRVAGLLMVLAGTTLLSRFSGDQPAGSSPAHAA